MVAFGSVAELPFVWNLADLFMALMAIVNLVAITLLGRNAFMALKDYQEQKKAGVAEVQTGVFGADMQVESVNDGPVTILMDTAAL